MKKLVIIMLFLLNFNIVQAESSSKNTYQESANTTVITNDNRVIYDEKTKQLIGVKKQTVCKQVNGKKECYDRSVATMIDK